MGELVLVGKGNTADVYQYSENKIIKVFHEGYPIECVKQEVKNASLFCSLYPKCPKCYGYIGVNGFKGIGYDLIKGKSLMEKFVIDQDGVFLLTTLVAIQTEFLKIKTEEALDYRVWLNLISRDALKEEVNSLPEGFNLCHGDFHPNNVLLNEKNEPFVIDFMNVVRAPVQYDIARTFFLLAPQNREFALMYLQAMGETELSIKPYFDIISKCRKFEK